VQERKEHQDSAVGNIKREARLVGILLLIRPAACYRGGGGWGEESGNPLRCILSDTNNATN
jgi:predicted Zn-ribbon and HTH transcriptional regulator